MRSLTDTEARVLLSLLGSAAERQAESIRRSKVPRSTFTVVRQRALSEGWIYERGIPSSSTGFTHVGFALAHPFMESAEGVGNRWSTEEGAVHLWQSPEMVFAAFFARSHAEGLAVMQRLGKGGGVQDLSTWLAPMAGPHVPVYFDYEGVWGHVAGHPALHYPRPLGLITPPGSDREASPGLRGNVRDMLHRPFRETRPGDGIHRFGPAGFPRSWRRLISRGWVDWRTLPDFSRIPAYGGTHLTRIVMLDGELREGKGPVELFFDLVGLARVYPFLYVVDGKRILIGTMGKGEGSKPEARGRPVFLTLGEHLSGIRITTCDLARLSVRLDHRYDRLFPA